MSAVTVIGYGEAGRTFARSGGWGASAHVYDIKTDASVTRNAKRAEYEADGVSGCETADMASAASPVILSLVTADQALAVASTVSRHIGPATLYIDMNSVAPDTKRAAAGVIEGAGGNYVDVAVMAPVDPSGMQTPLLVSGVHADAGEAALRMLGFANVRALGGPVGRASSIKMIRSVMIKGVEALTAEMMHAAKAADVTDEVLASLGNDAKRKAAYDIERMTTHGLRRAAEMEEVAKTLIALGVDPVMTRGTIRRQREMAQ
jgi:3-hydroxyisobutyrate dehydrogenase-like beta-hydroxyacid dehydrogenase